jgi:signal peptidase I
MEKTLRIALISVGILFVTCTLLGQTDMLKMYNIPTTANEPGIKLKSKIFVSNLVDYDNGDFVCYKFNDELLGEHIRVHRLLGKSGDMVEIKKGILYVNDVNIDKNIELKHFYILEPKEFKSLLDKELIEKEDMVFQTNNKIYIALIDRIADQNRLLSKIKLEPKSQADKMIKEVYNENWNADNFGPLKIPNGKCFVVGDNRHNSQDSRYNGLINESDIVGIVLRK